MSSFPISPFHQRHFLLLLHPSPLQHLLCLLFSLAAMFLQGSSSTVDVCCSAVCVNFGKMYCWALSSHWQVAPWLDSFGVVILASAALHGYSKPPGTTQSFEMIENKIITWCKLAQKAFPPNTQSLEKQAEPLKLQITNLQNKYILSLSEFAK